jgi:hypothetical protein
MSPELLPVTTAPDVLPNPIIKPDPELPKADPAPEPSLFITTLLVILRQSLGVTLPST